MKNAKYFRSILPVMAMATILATLDGCSASGSADAKTAADAAKVMTITFESTPAGLKAVTEKSKGTCVTPCTMKVRDGEGVGFFNRDGELVETKLGPWVDGRTYYVQLQPGAAAPPAASAKPEPTKPADNKKPAERKLALTVWRAEGPSTIVPGKCDTDNPVDLAVDDAVQFFALSPSISDPAAVSVDAPLKVVLRNNSVHIKIDLTGEKALKVGETRELKLRVGGQEFCIATRMVPGTPAPVARK